MIICVCRRLNEEAVREAVRAGAGSPKAVQAHHGCQFNCGKCKPAMADIVASEQRQLTEGAMHVAAE
ncbi:MAG: (2Fe-2S)-binding protein [Pseudomonadota bacterium]